MNNDLIDKLYVELDHVLGRMREAREQIHRMTNATAELDELDGELARHVDRCVALAAQVRRVRGAQ